MGNACSPSPMIRTPAEALSRPSARRAGARARRTSSFGTRPPMMHVGMARRLGLPVQLEGLVDRAPAGRAPRRSPTSRTFHFGRFRHVDGHVEPAGHARDVAHVELLHPRPGTDTSRRAPGPRGARGHPRPARSSAHRPPRVVLPGRPPSGHRTSDDARAACRRASRERPARRRRCCRGARVAAQTEPLRHRPPTRPRPAPSASGLRRDRPTISPSTSLAARRRPSTLTAKARHGPPPGWRPSPSGRAGPRPGPGCGRRRWWRRSA